MLKTKSCGVILVLALSAIVGTGIVLAQTTIDIQVAPATLNLNAEGKWVTVHTNISYGDVNTSSLMLNDNVTVAWTKADDCGNLVAKFNQEDVGDIVTKGDDVTLTLTGETTSGDEFTGSDTIRVIDEGK